MTNNSRKLVTLDSLIEVVECFPGYAFLKDVNQTYLTGSKLHAKIGGLNNIPQIFNRTDDDFPWEMYAEEYREDDNSVIQSKKPLIKVQKTCLEDGSVRSIVITKKPIIDENDEVFSIFGYAKFIDSSDIIEKINQITVDDENFFEKTSNLHYSIDKNFPGLTEKESECLFYLLRYGTSKKIARKMAISVRTVETHINNMKEKLNLYSKAGIIDYAISKKWILIIPFNLLVNKSF